MFKHILVPLDGSQRAEQALPLAAHLARINQSTIVLLKSIELMSTYNMQTVGISAIDMIEKMQEMKKHAAENYLIRVKNSALLEHIPIETEVCVGDAGSMILETSIKQNIDLIVLCSHGYTGFKQWALGSVTLKVARMSAIPVLIQRDEHPLSFAQGEQGDKEILVFRACIALDGSPQAEAVIEPALAIASACAPSHQGEVHLLRIIEPLSLADEEAFKEIYHVDIQNVIRQPAKKYIQDAIAHLQQAADKYPDIKITGTVMTGADIAQKLIQSVERDTSAQYSPYQFLAMTTHGRSGLNHWIFGSIAERVLNRTKLPLLIVRP
jgi:Universal stress protein UspA and related nucleotide-binding proteins